MVIIYVYESGEYELNYECASIDALIPIIVSDL